MGRTVARSEQDRRLDKAEYRDYFSEAFLSRFDELAWGVYKGEQ